WRACAGGGVGRWRGGGRGMGRVVEKEECGDRLGDGGGEVSNKGIGVDVRRLRKKIEPGGVRIWTGRGRGYCLGRVGPAAPADTAAPQPAVAGTPLR
ncbi:winged helix family transcriptional regulator, partial [Burkholderia contaminans]